MSLETNLNNLITAFVTDVRDISNSLAGAPNAKNATVMGALTTTAKNLVGAINEVKATADASSGAAVTSVNGEAGPGAVTLDTSHIAENGNLYLTEARVLASVLAGYAAAAGTVSATDSVIQAVQKLDGNIQAIDITALINDADAAATDTTYSASQIEARLTAKVAEVLDSAPAALDTLSELATALGNDANFATTVTNQLALKANIADTKSVTELGATVDTTDYATAYTTARDA